MDYFGSLYARSSVKRVVESMSDSAQKQQMRLSSLVEGISLFAARVDSHLQKLKIQRFGEVGEIVNPHLMEVLEVVDVEAGEPGTVNRLIRPGYRIGELVLKSAQVVAVSRKRSG